MKQQNQKQLQQREMDPARRQFMTNAAGAGVLAAFGGAAMTNVVWAQDAKPAAPPAPAGTVSNEAILKEKSANLKIHSERPLTGSVEAHHHNYAVTPTDHMYVRNNLLTPDLDPNKHVLRVRGLVDRPLELSLSDLRKYPVWSQAAMLECAGAGRLAFQPTPRGTPWSVTGGMGCPKWTGISLSDLLKAAGMQSGAVHIAFSGEDFGAVATAPKVIRSIPISKAMERHTMVAFGMNDGPLPKVHGFPVRIVVPGWAGSASVKWVSGIEVLAAPFKGTYMDDSYRVPKTPVAPGEKMPPDAVMAEAWPIKSMITHPAPNAKVPAGKPMLIEGRAWVGDATVERVDLSFNEGVTWVRAELNSGGDKFAWRVFSYAYTPRGRGYVTVLARATDSNGRTQPITTLWNPLGYYWNGIHRVGFMAEA